MKFKIGISQVVLVLFIGRILAVFTHSVSGGYTASELVSTLLGLPALLLLGWPILRLCGSKRSTGLLEQAKTLPSALSKTVCLIYGVYFFGVSVVTAGNFDLFFSHNLTHAPQFFSASLLLLIPAFYAVMQGAEGILRAGSVVSVVCIAVLTVTVVALLFQADPVYLTSSVPEGRRVLLGVANFVGQTPEIVALGVLAPHLKGSLKRGYRVLALSSVGAIFVMIAVTVSVLGGYISMTEFPFYTATGVFQLGPFQNLDAFQIGVWSLSGFVKSSFYLWICRFCFQSAFDWFKKPIPTALLVLAAILCAEFFSLDGLLPWIIPLGAAVLTAWVLPLLFLLRSQEKEVSSS